MHPTTQTASLHAMRASGGDRTQQVRILNYLEEHGPRIKDEIAAALELRASSVTARLNELVKAELVVITGTRWNPETRRTVSIYAEAAEQFLSRAALKEAA